MQEEQHQPAAVQRLDVRFTGSGSEYFRIWLVNLLLTIVTLGLYHPFAKARKLAYFQGNTLVGGEPLGFHGNPWKMLRGYLLMLLFGVAYGVGGHFSPMVALASAMTFMLLWPALWRASLQFRLGNTSWRGLRFGFDGSLGGAYRAMLPGLIPWAAFLAVAILMPQAGADGADGADTDADAAAAALDPRFGTMLAVAMLAMFVLLPLALAWVKRYQHGHYLYANQRSRLDAGTGAFYAYSLKLLGVALVPLVLLGVLMAVGFGVAAASGNRHVGTALLVLGMLAFYAGYFVIVLPFGQSRLQNLVWGRTRSPALQCHSALRLGPLGRLTLKNLALTVVTIGLYWPFAAISAARMRLNAMTLDLSGDMAQWTAGPHHGAADATGDAAGDFFGIDLGL
jgi:uncharacterized membrane protein YjgN (DUF898 family)